MMQVIRTLPHKLYNCEEIIEIFYSDFCARVKWTPENNYIPHENEHAYVLDDSIQCQVGWRVRDGMPQAPEVEVLEDMKIDRISIIKEARKEFEYGGLAFNGLTVETDNNSQAKLTSAMVTYQVTQVLPPAWKCKDGWYPINNIDDFTALASAVQNHVNQCFIKEHTLETNIKAAASIDDLKAIYWN